MSESNTSGLRGKLETISILERKHRIIGVSCQVEDVSGPPILARDMADHIITIIKDCAEITANPDSVPKIADILRSEAVGAQND